MQNEGIKTSSIQQLIRVCLCMQSLCESVNFVGLLLLEKESRYI